MVSRTKSRKIPTRHFLPPVVASRNDGWECWNVWLGQSSHGPHREPFNSTRWGSIRFHPLACAYAPWAVRVGELAKSRKIPTRENRPLHFRVFAGRVGRGEPQAGELEQQEVPPLQQGPGDGARPGSDEPQGVAVVVRAVRRSLPPHRRSIYDFFWLPARAPHGRTRGEPNETKKNTHPGNATALCWRGQEQDVGASVQHALAPRVRVSPLLRETVHLDRDLACATQVACVPHHAPPRI